MPDKIIEVPIHVDTKDAEDAIEKLTEEVDAFQQKANTPSAFSLDTSDAEEDVVRLRDAIIEVEDEIDDVDLPDGASNSADNLKLKFEQIGAVFKKAFSVVGEKAVTAFDRIRDTIQPIIYGWGQVDEDSESIADDTDKIGQGFDYIKRRLATILKNALFFTVISKGIRRMVAYMGDALQANQQWTKAVGELKGAMQTLAQPLVNAVLPVLLTIVNLITAIISHIASAISWLFGTTLKQSAQSASKVASGLGKGAKNAERIKKALAGFDEINTLDTKDDASSGGYGGGGSSPTFDFVNGIKEQLMELEVYVASFALALGVILTLSGANVPLGLGLIAVGALTLTGIARENPGYIEQMLDGTFGKVLKIAGGAMALIGLILLPFNLPLGVALFLTGLWALALSVGSVDSTAGQTQHEYNFNQFLANVLSIAGRAVAVLGLVVLLFNLPLGVAMLIAGIGMIWSGAKVGPANTSGVEGDVSAFLDRILGIASKGALGLGIILLMFGQVGLGLALIVGGATALGVSALDTTPDTSELEEGTKSMLNNMASSHRDTSTAMATSWQKFKKGVKKVFGGISKDSESSSASVVGPWKNSAVKIAGEFNGLGKNAETTTSAIKTKFERTSQNVGFNWGIAMTSVRNGGVATKQSVNNSFSSMQRASSLSFKGLEQTSAEVFTVIGNDANTSSGKVKTSMSDMATYTKTKGDEIQNKYADAKSGVWANLRSSFQTAYNGNNGIQTIAGWLDTTMTNKATSISDTYVGKGGKAGVWDNLKNSFKNSYNGSNGIQTVAGWLQTTMSNKASAIISLFDVNSKTGAWAKLKQGAHDAWEAIKQVFSNVTGWFSKTFGEAWTSVKNVFSDNGITFQSIKETLSETFKNLVNKLIDGLNGVIKKPFDAVNDLITSMRNSWFGPLSAVGYKLSYVTAPQIPHLATGGVIPPNREFLAMLGDNKTETEVVSPLSTMKDAMLEAMREAGLGSGQTIQVNVDGKQLFQIIVDQNNSTVKRTGYTPLLV